MSDLHVAHFRRVQHRCRRRHGRRRCGRCCCGRIAVLLLAISRDGHQANGFEMGHLIADAVASCGGGRRTGPMVRWMMDVQRRRRRWIVAFRGWIGPRTGPNECGGRCCCSGWRFVVVEPGGQKGFGGGLLWKIAETMRENSYWYSLLAAAAEGGGWAKFANVFCHLRCRKSVLLCDVCTFM